MSEHEEIVRRIEELLASVRGLVDALPDELVEAYAPEVHRVCAALEACAEIAPRGAK